MYTNLSFTILPFIKSVNINLGASLVAQMVKHPPAMQETQVQSLGWEDPLEKKMTPTSVFLPGEFHGQRSLADYSPWDRKELETMEQLTHNINSISYSFLVLGIILLPDIRKQET